MRGNCYCTSEAIYHLTGGKAGPWVPQVMRHEGDTHWFLKHRETGVILDATVKQFREIPNYSEARGSGFLTAQPSKRAHRLMERLLWQGGVE